MLSQFPSDWNDEINITNKISDKKLEQILYEKDALVFPPKSQIFRAFELCPYKDVKVIIIGQDPYHTAGQANGLAFSCVSEPIQPSLRNILKEVERSTKKDIKSYKIERGDLEPWATQGVLLLNTVLTVQAGKARSHAGKGWEEITQTILYTLLEQKRHLVVMQWGKDAAQIRVPKDAKQHHLFLQASHPSPFSYKISFEGCNHFALCNEYLVKHDIQPIAWN